MMDPNPNDGVLELNICHICDQEFEELELHFIIFHTSQQIDDDKKEEIPNIENTNQISENNGTKVEENANPFDAILNNDCSDFIKGSTETIITESPINIECDIHRKKDDIIGENAKNTKDVIENRNRPDQHQNSEENIISQQIAENVDHNEGIASNKCDICDKKLSRPDHLKRHKLIHESVKPLICQICGRSFQEHNLDSFKKHLLIHKRRGETENSKKYKCKNCEKEFFRITHLSKHRKRDHQNKLKKLHNIKKGESKCNNVYKCDICDKSFTKPNKLKKHIHIVHDRQKDYICEKCNKSFTTAGILKQHIHIVHDGRKDYTCDKLFTTSAILKKHVYKVHNGHKLRQHKLKTHQIEFESNNGKKYKCDICDKSFANPRNLRVHIRQIHQKELNHRCDICEKMFFQPSHLRQHQLKTHKIRESKLEVERKYKCEICTKRFSQLSNFTLHRRKIHQIKIEYKCSICDKLYSESSNLTKHRKKVHKEKISDPTLKCNMCEGLFSTDTGLREHKKWKHKTLKDISLEKLTCDICDKTFSNRSNFEKHKKWIHNTVSLEKLICDICDKTFSDPYKVIKHQKRVHQGSIHEGKRSHKCQICGKEYASNFKLNGHIKGIHESGNFRCELCNKDFTQAVHLKSHQKLSHEIGGIQCELCGKTFATNSGLNFHINHVHEKIKNHQCDDCEISFAHRGHLLAHIKNIHLKIKDNKCEFCVKSFAKKTYLKLHIKMVHERTKDVFCDTCNKAFTNNTACNLHIKFVHKGNNGKCRFCSDAIFQTYHGLRYHLKRFHCDNPKLKTHVCEICQKVFHTKVNLKFHIKNVHVQGKINQEKSPNLLNSNGAAGLKQHIKVLKKQYKCKSCGNSFSHADALKQHIYIIHEGRKDFKCDSCGKSFSLADLLKGHNHEDKCDSCGTAFSTKHSLEQHSLKTGVKPETCTSYNKAFTQRHTLKYHTKSVHEGKTIHKGPKSYTTNTTAREQIIEVNEKILKCYLCGKNIDQKFLKTHERICDKKLKHVDENAKNLLENLPENSLVTVDNEQDKTQEVDTSECNNKVLSINKIQESSEENFQSGFVECVICDLSFYGTSSTLKMHMNDVHQKENPYIRAHEGQEKIVSSMNPSTSLIQHDLNKHEQHENDTIYVNVEKISESTVIKLEKDTNQILNDPLSIPEKALRYEENNDKEIIDPLNIPENPIKTEKVSVEQKLINSVEDSKRSVNPIENESYSCKSCRKNFGEEKLLKTHERFCAK